MKIILLLGGSGKMGNALKDILQDSYKVIAPTSSILDVREINEVKKFIKNINPDIVINTVAFLGIDPCEVNPEKAFQLNTIFPWELAKFSNEFNFLLIHFSTDAVFADIDTNKDAYSESDIPSPNNIYGMTKLGGDIKVKQTASRYYLIRISVLFGLSEKSNQFVEKMLSMIQNGSEEISVSNDIICTPCYNKDVALEVRNIFENKYDYGLYHVVNKGKASLYELMVEILCSLNIGIKIKPVSYKTFPYIGTKNLRTQLKTERLTPMRDWKDAVKEYCKSL